MVKGINDFHASLNFIRKYSSRNAAALFVTNRDVGVVSVTLEACRNHGFNPQAIIAVSCIMDEF